MGSNTKQGFAVINAGGIDFTLTEGQVAHVPAERFDDLCNAGYLVPPKKGLTLAGAKAIAEKQRAAHLEALAAQAEADASATDPAPVDDQSQPAPGADAAPGSEPKPAAG